MTLNKSLLECPICFEYYTKPRILTVCGHTICELCIINIKNKYAITCPLCNIKTICRYTNELKINYIVNDMVEDVLKKKQSSSSLSTSCPECCKIHIPVIENKKSKDDTNIDDSIILSDPINTSIFLMDEDLNDNSRECCNIFTSFS